MTEKKEKKKFESEEESTPREDVYWEKIKKQSLTEQKTRISISQELSSDRKVIGFTEISPN